MRGTPWGCAFWRCLEGVILFLTTRVCVRVCVRVRVCVCVCTRVCVQLGILHVVYGEAPLLHSQTNCLRDDRCSGGVEYLVNTGVDVGCVCIVLSSFFSVYSSRPF